MSSVVHESVPPLSRRKVEQEAGKYLKKYNLTDVPIDLLALASCEGIEVNNARFVDKGMAGMIVKKGKDVTILVNRDDPPYRKRFTIAHELGHYFLHLTNDGQYVDKEANMFRRLPGEDEQSTTDERRSEIQANMFAAALLMPEEDVRRYWEKHESIEYLAEIFSVSREAMGNRVDTLGLG